MSVNMLRTLGHSFFGTGTMQEFFHSLEGLSFKVMVELREGEVATSVMVPLEGRAESTAEV